nr:oxygenase MpaB family protein [Streptomyces sp. LBUM 1487]
MGPPDAHGELRRYDDVRDLRGRRTGRCPRPEDPPPAHGDRPGHGERYAVDEPGLLLWVHCAEIDSYLHILRRSGYPLTEAAADRYVGEHRVSARLVGLDPEAVPGDRAELAAYFEAVRPELAAGPEARAVDDFLLRPHAPAARPGTRGAVAARGEPRVRLPAAVRPSAVRQGGPAPAVVTRRLRRTATLLRRVPARLRWRLPPQHILRAMARLGPGSRPAPHRAGR